MFQNIIIVLLGLHALALLEEKQRSSCTVCCGDSITRTILPEICSTFFPPEVTEPHQTSPSPFELNINTTDDFNKFRVWITATNGSLMTEWIIIPLDVDGEDNGKGIRYDNIPGRWYTNQHTSAHKCCEMDKPTMIYEFGHFKHDVGVKKSNVYRYYCDCGSLKHYQKRHFMLRAIVFSDRSKYWIINKQLSATRPKRKYPKSTSK